MTKPISDYPPDKFVKLAVETLNELCFSCEGLGNCIKCQTCLQPSETTCRYYRDMFKRKKQ